MCVVCPFRGGGVIRREDRRTLGGLAKALMDLKEIPVRIVIRTAGQKSVTKHLVALLPTI